MKLFNLDPFDAGYWHLQHANKSRGADQSGLTFNDIFRPSSLAVNLSESKDEYVVHCDLPGLNKEDVKASIKDNILTIEGERKDVFEKSSEDHAVHYQECSYGSFSRRIQLPNNAKSNSVKSKFENGVLELKFAKKSEDEGKHTIEI